MKTTLKTGFAAMAFLLAISCKKENSTIQSSSIAYNNITSGDITSINAPAKTASVKIGTQVWKTGNLNVARYRNGDHIPQVKDPAEWGQLTTGAWCWYNNDSANCSIYGKLYNWYAVNDPRGLAPEGWHIPTQAEWTTLVTFLGGQPVAGGKMKSTGTIEAGTGLWHAPNTDATNSSGFTALPGGYHDGNGIFYDIGTNGFWWSATDIGSGSAALLDLYYNDGYAYIYGVSNREGFSVRCLRN